MNQWVSQESPPSQRAVSITPANAQSDFLQALQDAGLDDVAVVGGGARDRRMGVSRRGDIDVQLTLSLSRSERSHLDRIRRFPPLPYTMAARRLIRQVQRRHLDAWTPFVSSGVLARADLLLQGGAQFDGKRVHIAKHVLLTKDGPFIPENLAPTYELIAMTPRGEWLCYEDRVLDDIDQRKIRISGQGIMTMRTVMRTISLKHQFAGTAYDEATWKAMAAFGVRLQQGGLFARYNLYSRYARRINLDRLGETLQRSGGQWELAVEDLRRLGILALMERASGAAYRLVRYRASMGADAPHDVSCESLLARYPRDVYSLDAKPIEQQDRLPA